MSKNTFFTGQPVLNQLLNLIDRNAVRSLARAGQHDRYYRYFDTYTHLVTMLYCTLNKCTSSREVVSGMKACSNKLGHAGISKAPGRSTLCDANMKRSYKIFEQFYQQIYLQSLYFSKYLKHPVPVNRTVKEKAASKYIR